MILVLDCETQALSTDPAPDGRPIGWSLDRRGYMGISWACAFRSLGRDRWFMHHFDSQDLDRFVRMIEAADLVVTYNGISFDVPLIEAVVGRRLSIRSHCDIILPIKPCLGHRLSLDDLAQANLGIGKSGYGGHAPQLWRDGKFGALAEYCARDVEVTRDIYLAARKGYLLSPDGREIPYTRELLLGETGRHQKGTIEAKHRQGIKSETNVSQNG